MKMSELSRWFLVGFIVAVMFWLAIHLGGCQMIADGSMGLQKDIHNATVGK